MWATQAVHHWPTATQPWGQLSSQPGVAQRDSGEYTMAHEGTVVNGAIVLDGGEQLPEGARVRIELADPAPPTIPFDREQELTNLRESLADVRAGKGMPFEEFMAKIAKEYHLPVVQPE